MKRKWIQLVFPLIAILPCIVYFFCFGNTAGQETPSINVYTPSFIGLNETASKQPRHTPVFEIAAELSTPYFKMFVATTHDGEKWVLEEVAGRKESVSNAKFLSSDSLTATHQGFDRDALKEARAINDPLYLDLPVNISDRVKNLAGKITEGLETPFEKAEAIETFVRVRYEYNLNFTPAPKGWESTDWFLFEAQEGICGDFNSAFVMLSRSAGVPARFVAGYYVEPGVDEQTVYSDQGHAWAEIEFEGLGWITFDATPTN